MPVSRRFNQEGFGAKLHLLRQTSGIFIFQIGRSRYFRLVVAAIFVGLSIARLLHSIALFTYQTAQPLPLKPTPSTRQDPVPATLPDPATVLGGILFQPASENRAAEKTVTTAPMKPFKLTGTLESGAQYSRALIETQGESIREYCTAMAAAKNRDCLSTVQGFQITSIAKEHIWLKHGSDRRKLLMGQTLTETADAGNTDPSGAMRINSGSATIITKPVSREELARILKGSEGPIFTGNFGPHVVDGKIQGYKIVKISEDHIFARLGAKNGDLVRKVNGYTLNDLERMMDVYKSLPRASEIKIELERDGKTITYDFHIRN